MSSIRSLTINLAASTVKVNPSPILTPASAPATAYSTPLGNNSQAMSIPNNNLPNASVICDNAVGFILFLPWKYPFSTAMPLTKKIDGAIARYPVSASGVPCSRAATPFKSISAAVSAAPVVSIAASAPRVRRIPLAFSPAAEYDATNTDIAIGTAPPETDSISAYTGYTDWYTPIPSAPSILVSGMRYNAPKTFAPRVASIIMPAPPRSVRFFFIRCVSK